MADLVAGDAADCAAGGPANAGLAALQHDLAYRVDRRHAHGLLAPRFMLAVHVRRLMGDARGKRRGKRKCDKCVLHHRYPFQGV